jgi:hypothetical protein
MLKWVKVVGACAALVWSTAKIRPLARALTPPAPEVHGDLFAECPVADFALPVPTPLPMPKYAPIDQADTIVVGDSFSGVSYGHMPLPALLERAMSTTVAISNVGDDPNPVHLITPTAEHLPKTVLLESVERYLSYRFAEGRSERTPSEARRVFGSLRAEAFLTNDQEITFLLTRNPWMQPIRAGIVTARYRLLGEMCNIDAVFSANPPMLFLDETTNSSSTSYFADHQPVLVDSIADNVAAIDAELKKRGIHLVFMPVPNKVTVYADLVTEVPYDRFITRVVRAARTRGVCSLDLFPMLKDMRARGEQPYYPTDTHWTLPAVERAVSLIVAAAKSPSLLPAVASSDDNDCLSVP